MPPGYGFPPGPLAVPLPYGVGTMFPTDPNMFGPRFPGAPYPEWRADRDYRRDFDRRPPTNS